MRGYGHEPLFFTVELDGDAMEARTPASRSCSTGRSTTRAR